MIPGLKNPEYVIIENHEPVIEVRKVTDPEEVRNKEHSPIDREAEYLDDCAQERCPEGDHAQGGEEE